MPPQKDDLEPYLMIVYNPADGEPGITEDQVQPLQDTVNMCLTDPAQKIMALAAIDARRPLSVVNSIIYDWPNIKA